MFVNFLMISNWWWVTTHLFMRHALPNELISIMLEIAWRYRVCFPPCLTDKRVPNALTDALQTLHVRGVSDRCSSVKY